MFEDRLEVALGDRSALADLAGDLEQESRIVGCRKLVIAAAVADAHSEVDHPEGGVLVERLVTIGPAGCPLVAEFAPQSLVGPFATTILSARSWIADALSIRHRLPRLWERVVAGQVHHWKARQIATKRWMRPCCKSTRSRIGNGNGWRRRNGKSVPPSPRPGCGR